MNSVDVTVEGHYIYADSKGSFYVKVEDYEALRKELKRLKEQAKNTGSL